MGSPVCKLKECRNKMDEHIIGGVKVLVQRGQIGATRIPPLDGFVVLEVDPDLPEEEDEKRRTEWFASKAKKESRQ